jgi:hypothetical protein
MLVARPGVGVAVMVAGAIVAAAAVFFEGGR